MVCSVIFSEESFEYWDCYFVELPDSYLNVVATGEIELESVCLYESVISNESNKFRYTLGTICSQQE